MNKVIFSLVLFIMFFGLWLYFVQNPQTTTVVVMVTDESLGGTAYFNGKPTLAGKRIILEKVPLSKEQPKKLFGSTNEDGLFLFKDVPLGEWKVFIYGYNAGQDKLLVIFNMAKDANNYEYIIRIDNGYIVTVTVSKKVKI